MRAVFRDGNRPVISIDPCWDSRLLWLREKGRAGGIACPHCGADVLLKAGAIVRRHFAHKALADCKAAGETAEVLDLRAALYSWLVAKFPENSITVEHWPKDSGLPRPVDVWVHWPDKGRDFAYWVVAKRILEEEVLAITGAVERLGASLTWVFPVRLLRKAENRPGMFHLSATQRRCLMPTEYDEPCGGGCSLFFLDPEQSKVAILRGVNMGRCGPVCGAEERRCGLEEAQIRPKTGHFVAPGEYDELKAHRKREEQRRKEAEARKAAAAARRKAEQERWAKQRAEAPPPPEPKEERPPPQFPEWDYDDEPAERTGEPVRPDRPPVPCVLCGVLTPAKDQDIYYGQTGTCKCRDCMKG